MSMIDYRTVEAPVVFNFETVLASSHHDLAIAKSLFDDFRAFVLEEQPMLLQSIAQISSDREALRKRVHRLKSSAGFVGADRVSHAAATLQEYLLAPDSSGSIERALRALIDAMQEFSGISSFENAFRLFKLTKRERSSVRGHKAAEDGEVVKPPQASS